jgi:mannose-6-phosphate isomerase-like protein (cupin superfamily)
MKTIRIENIEAIPVVGGELQWRPVRRTLGIEAFGINAYTADAGELVVEEHDETGAGAGHHEELYMVITGRATFTVDGESFDAPVGTLVFLDDPKERRGARAEENGTTVLAIGGMRGQAFRVSPWEFAFAGVPRTTPAATTRRRHCCSRGSSCIRAIRACCSTSPATKP